MDLAIGTKY